MIDAAVIGMGYWGPRVVTSLNDAPDKIRVARAVDVNPEASRAFCDEHGIPLGTDFDGALQDPAVDAVILCTPHVLHADQIAVAAVAGKHVFCEKPLTLTKESAARAVTACKDGGVVLGVGHERRFERPMTAIAELVADGTLGTILHVEGNFSHDKFVGRSGDDWRFEPSEGPSPGMTGMGIHLTDAMIGMLGPVAEVRAVTARRVMDIPTGDVIAVQLVFACGATGFMAAVSATPYYDRFTVLGADGWAEAQDDAHPEVPVVTHLTVAAKDGSRTVTDYPPFDIVRANFEAFAEAAMGGAPYPITPEQMVHNVAVFEAIGASAASGGAVSVD